MEILNTINDIINFDMINAIEEACTAQLFDGPNDVRLFNIITMLYYEAHDIIGNTYTKDQILGCVIFLVVKYCVSHHKYM